MAITKKEFLKKYADTMNNITGDGVWSGRGGPGIPIGGAMFGGDDYKEKIGREKIPWYLSDFRGRPSMAADSGFSSIVMSRVNKGRDEKYDPSPMFPDQDVKEDDEVDNYIAEMQGFSDMKQSYFKEDQIVNNSKYSLEELSKIMEEQIEWRRFIPDPIEDAAEWAGDNWRSAVPDFLEDEAEAAASAVSDVIDMGRDAGSDAAEYIQGKIEELGADAETFDEVKEKALEIGRDFLAMTAMGIPVIGTYAAASFVLYNMAELDNAYGELQESLDRLFVDGTEEDLRNLELVTSRIFDDYIDMLQASTYLIPFVGSAKGIIGSASRLLARSKAVGAARFFGLAGNRALSSAIRSEILLSPVFKFVVEISESDLPDSLGIDKSRLYDVVVRTPAWLSVATKIIKSALTQLNRWTGEGSQGEFRFDPAHLDLSDDESRDVQQRLTADNYRSGLASWVTEEMENIRDGAEDVVADAAEDIDTNLFQEKKEMKSKESLLRQFIRESIYHATQVELDAQPTGYVYRNPPTSDEDVSDSLGSGKDLVNFKTDMGYASYQSRPEDLREEALRRIIRRKIKILESKKKN